MRVAILGSGLSGLVAAWALGPTAEVVVMEPTHRLGGAEASLALPGGGAIDAPDLAAPAGTAPRLLALHAQLGLAVAWQTRPLGLYDRATDDAIDLDASAGLDRLALRVRGRLDTHDALLDAFTRLGEPPTDRDSVAWHLLRDGREGAALRRWVFPWLPTLLGRPGATPYEVRAAAAAPLPGLGGRRHARTRLGHTALLEALLVATGHVRLRLGVQVARVEARGGGVRVEVQGRRAERFDAVVLALEPAAAAALLPGARTPPAAPPGRLVVHRDPSLVPAGARDARWISWLGHAVAITEPAPTTTGPPAWTSRLLGGCADPVGILARQEPAWPPPPPQDLVDPSLRAHLAASGLVLALPGPSGSREARVAAGLEAAAQLCPDSARAEGLRASAVA